MNIKYLSPWVGLAFGLFLACSLSLIFNENPILVFKVLVTSFFNSKFDLGLTLFYTTCLIFSGLAFAIPMKAGLFHIGAEGQLLISALTAAYLGISISPYQNIWSVAFSVFTLVFVTLLVGTLSASVIAAFKIFKQAHEVVVAIMLNFILAAVSTWATVNRLQSTTSQNPETALISTHFQFLKTDFLKTYFENSPVSIFLFVALLSCFILYFIETRTLLASQIKAYGQNPQAAARIGISGSKILFISLGSAGFFSSLLALTEILGNTFQYKIGFSPQYGFLGIAVSLLAQQNFIGIIGSAFLMACLHKGASDLDLETAHLTRDFSRVLQAIIIFSVAASYYLFNRKRNK